MQRWEEGLEELLSDYVHLLKAGVRICDWKSWTMWRRINLLTVTNQGADKTKKHLRGFRTLFPRRQFFAFWPLSMCSCIPLSTISPTLNFTLSFITFITTIFVTLVTIVFRSSLCLATDQEKAGMLWILVNSKEVFHPIFLLFNSLFCRDSLESSQHTTKVQKPPWRKVIANVQKNIWTTQEGKTGTSLCYIPLFSWC